jgi:glutamine amidotransferase
VIAILDACSGNLRSVQRAIEHVGGTVAIARDADTVRRADKLVVPGQGTFGMFMRGLAERGLGEAVRDAIARGTPYLGICLGLQVLFEHSDEGDCAGLGVLAGRVTKLVPGAPQLKIPHMGWNRVAKRRDDPLLADVADGERVYFVHSYRVEPADRDAIVLEAEHGVTFCAAVRRGNLFACQFHPEKSQAVGARILRRFVEAA